MTTSNAMDLNLAPQRIMCVGDSMTIGVPGDFTWRYRLFQHLFATEDSPVILVGPEHGLYDRDNDTVVPGGYRDPLFPRGHAAAWGRGLRHVSAIEAYVARHRPTVVLVMLGLIDLGFYAHVQETEEHLRRFVAGARAAAPRAGLVLAEVPPAVRARDDAWFAAEVAQYNERLRACAEELSSARSPVVAAALTDTYDIGADTYDGTHPNERGEHKIAAMFADAISEHFGIGARYPVSLVARSPDAPERPTMPA